MSYLQKLYETYNNLSMVDSSDSDATASLLPMAHSTQKAHISVVIDVDGNFQRADFVADEVNKVKNLSETLVPVNEKSSSRSSGSAPHPLCDKLKYLAGDYNKYVLIKKDRDKNDINYSEYLSQLEKWANSDYTTPKVKAIYLYIKKGTLTKDLIDSDIFSTENGYLTEKWEKANVKLSVGIQSDAFIRFVVIGDTASVNVWEDKYLQEQYIKYYLNTIEQSGKKDFCCICGEEKVCSESHPKKIRHSGDQAKLISSNDTSGFTYRGRFENPNEAVTISYEVSQKAHNALKYLIQKQGERIGDKVFLLWGTYGEETPIINADTYSFSDGIDDELGLWDEDDTSIYADIKQASARRFNLAIKGYKSKLDYDTQYAILGLDSATTGRMSVIYYREYYGEKQIDSLLDNIEKWHTNSSWYHNYKFVDKNRVSFYGAPSLYDIATFAYGKQEGEFVKGDDKIVGKATERLFRSLVDGTNIPRDIVSILVRKAYCPQNYSENNWNKLMSITCSVYRKYLYDYKGEVAEMNIDNENKDISYNCGRLLAVADAIERYAQYEKGEKERTTNAMRYFTRFSNYPCITWGRIRKNITPYIASLGQKGRYLNLLIEEISANIDPEEFRKAKNLDGNMALGFDTQKNAIEEHKNSKKQQNKEDK